LPVLLVVKAEVKADDFPCMRTGWHEDFQDDTLKITLVLGIWMTQAVKLAETGANRTKISSVATRERLSQ